MLWTCQNCGVVFKRNPARVRTPKFCSRKCRGEYEHKEGNVEVLCNNCGAKIFYRRSKVLKNKHNFCNIKCMSGFNSKYRTKENSPNWKGGRGTTKDGYIWVLCPIEFETMAHKSGMVLEHRLVMAQYMGQCPQQKEVVHHVGSKSDNRIENLKLFKNHGDHIRYGHPNGVGHGKKNDIKKVNKK